MKRTPLRRKSGIKPKSAKKAQRQTSEALAHMAAVKTLPCVICGVTPTEAHHCISHRYGSAKRGDEWTIPMCSSCHRTSPYAIHNGKRSWEEQHGPDYCFLPRVYAMLGKEMPEEIKEMIDGMATY